MLVLILPPFEGKIQLNNRQNLFETDLFQTEIHFSEFSTHSCPDDLLVNDAVANIEGKIKHVRLVGERHSGIKDLSRLLRSHLINVTVHEGLGRGPFWFQDEYLASQEVNLDETLILLVTRNPYKWMFAMMNDPIHAPNHLDLSWKKFISQPWTIKTSVQDKEVSQTEGAVCQENFLGKAVVPCRRRDTVVDVILSSVDSDTRSVTYPVYETHIKDKRPFKNIIQLRRGKLLNLFNISKWKSVKFVQFISIDSLFSTQRSSLMQRSQINTLLEQLFVKYSLSSCLLSESEVFKTKYFSDEVTFKNFKQSKVRNEIIDEYYDLFKYLTCNVHWKVENKFGYSKIKQFLYDLKTTKKIKCSKSVHHHSLYS